ncbi:uncharacterized protein LOC127838711 [Dreissena polymorpha]|uniref:Uncharacterized protein n=1 Tax=Dreissena polymorpha TaxID=45954 RepID=A0A9D4J1U8_DREPO|nr:uncharacterized protein LOC127838711 [Dreissena polymorpha]XP_052222625.1 uncharacterized protein LOC127838711 [Dreissena polymorpha]KAH3792678.1 hypothetical protein DPMN_146177 [Dreissena polymorpha]
MTEGGARRDTPGFHRQVPMSNQALENASKETSTVMSWLGYGPEIRRARGDEYRKLGKNNSSGVVTWSIVGSKAEGLTCVFESDQDMLKILNSVICLEDGVNASTFHREMTVLRSYSRLSYPGHCRLLLERSGTPIPSKVNDAFCDDEYGREILSNDLYLKNWSKKLPGENVARAGPSLPTTLRGVLHYDNVHAFRYHCPHILSKWAARPRHWPPPEAVQKVVSLGAFLAPVGFKGSEHKDFEWRVCFNAGEIELVNNLNDTQIKVYVLLKMVKSAVLNPRKKEVSSYTLKNIVLWIAEKKSSVLVP